MDNREKILNDYYSNYDEDSRLIKDNTHRLEFITTDTYINKYLKEIQNRNEMINKNTLETINNTINKGLNNFEKINTSGSGYW